MCKAPEVHLDVNVELSPNHKRALRAAFQSIDGLLTEAEGALESRRSKAVFSKHVDDAVPAQCNLAHDQIFRIRERMRARLTEFDIPLPPPACGSLKAARTSAVFAGIDLEEISPSRMIAFGKLPIETARRLREVQLELKRMLSGLEGVLSAPAEADLAAMIKGIENPGDVVAMLGELERLVSRYKLIPLREALKHCIEHARIPSFEIAVFGRSNCGKSSLLNYLLNSTVLPVGATPVTAVPICVRDGGESCLRLTFADGRQTVLSIEALADFAAEERNPENRRRVSRIEVTLPASRLRGGVRLVDTPGLGSLAGAADHETAAYLPRCDVGIVLIDAASGPSPADFQLVQALRQAGASPLLLLSKADLLAGKERARMISHARDSLYQHLKIECPVFAVSVRETALTDFWWEGAMKAQVAYWRQSAAAALRRKVAVLRYAVADAIRHMLQALKTASIMDSPSANPRILLAAEESLEAAFSDNGNSIGCANATVDGIGGIFAKSIARAWTSKKPASLAVIFAEATAKILGPLASAYHDRYIHLRDRLEQALEKSIPGMADYALDDLPGGCAIPVFEPDLLGRRLDIPQPVGLRLFGESFLAYFAQRHFRRQIGDALHVALTDYQRDLHEWLNRALQELRATFEAMADLQRDPLLPSVKELAVDPLELERDLAALDAPQTAVYDELASPAVDGKPTVVSNAPDEPQPLDQHGEASDCGAPHMAMDANPSARKTTDAHGF